MGLSYQDFIRMTWAQFVYAYRGWGKRKIRDRFEGAREIIFTLASINRDPKKHFPKSSHELWPLPTDEKIEAPTQERVNSLRARIKLAELQYKEKYG